MKMFLKVAFAVTCTLAVSLCSCERPTADYLLLDEGYYHKELHRIVKRIDSGQWGNDLHTVASNLRLLRDSTMEAVLKGHNENPEAAKIDTSGYDSNRIYTLYTAASNLLTFYEPPKGIIDDCNNHQARIFVELVHVVFKSFKKFQKSLESPSESLLAQFMQKYGEQHSKDCLNLLQERYDATVKHLPKVAEEKMDVLVSMGEEYEPNERDSRLLAQAESTDLAVGKFNAKKMLDALASTNFYIGETKTDKKFKSLDSGKLLADFISTTCGQLRSAGIPFDMYNLAKFFAPQAVSSLELPMRFKKLNEYSRICIPFDNYKLEKNSMSNVVNNMVRQKVRKTLFLD